MKLDRVIWGILLLFIGGVVLLDNFDIIEFYWSNAWSFLPVLIIILGINILFSRNNSQTGNIISLVILIISLGFLFIKGQQSPDSRFWWGSSRHEYRDNDEDDKGYTTVNFASPFEVGDADRKAVLNIFGEVTSFKLNGATDSLVTVDVRKRRGEFALTKTTNDSTNTITFKTKDNRKKRWSMGNGNDADFYLNTAPVWHMNVNLGAGSADFDLSNYKVRTFNFEGGVAELDVKIGSLLPITDVMVKTGVTDVKVSIPEGSGCRIKTNTGLSSRDFEGFTKVSDDTYETANYKSSTNKVFINFNGGLTSFEVDRY